MVFLLVKVITPSCVFNHGWRIPQCGSMIFPSNLCLVRGFPNQPSLISIIPVVNPHDIPLYLHCTTMFDGSITIYFKDFPSKTPDFPIKSYKIIKSTFKLYFFPIIFLRLCPHKATITSQNNCRGEALCEFLRHSHGLAVALLRLPGGTGRDAAALETSVDLQYSIVGFHICNTKNIRKHQYTNSAYIQNNTNSNICNHIVLVVEPPL